MNESPSLIDRFFWPATVLAVLVLGGFATVIYKTLTRPSPQIAAARNVEPAALIPSTEMQPAVPKKVLTAEQAAAMDALRTEAEQDKQASNAAGSFAIGALPVAVETAVPKAEMEEESPYVVPANKPFITREGFEQQAAKMEAARKAAAKLKPKPAVVVKPAATPAAATPSTVAAAKPASPPAMLGVARPHVYVTKDGRRIAVLKTVDLGDSYGLKTAAGQILTISKDDITEIIKP